MTNIDARELFNQLIIAESEIDLIHILKSFNLWDTRDNWRPYGDIPNNLGIVHNQQSSPVAALVEKIVNSIDAILISESNRKGIKPSDKSAPRSMQDAVKMFFNITGGKIHLLDAKARTSIANRIQIITSGSKTEPNYIIIDDGEGQNPMDFSTTFLSLLRENKTSIPFVQGRFNMGGTGVLQFTGKNSFQLIVSRKQQDLPDANIKWGFTITRRIEPSEDQSHSLYVYLAPNDNILSFEAEYIMAYPGDYPNLYSEAMTAGTFIKLWNYKLPGRLKSIATLDLRYALEKFLPDPALPIRIRERRNGYRAHSYDTTISGLFSVLADNPSHIETGFDTGTPLTIQNVGIVDLRLILLKEDSEQDRYPSGIFFIVNGQMHSDELGKDFIARRTKLDYVANNLIVFVDCTNLQKRVIEDLFLASRDRMRRCEERTLLEDSIVEYLKDHQGLKEANSRRRQERLSNMSEEDSIEIIQTLIHNDPTLANLFGSGQKIKIPQGPLPQKAIYKGKKYPSFFNIFKEPQGGLMKHCPINRNTRVEFETDAENDYFSRSLDPGKIEVNGLLKVKSIHLWNGIASIRFSLPINCSVGDSFTIDVNVNDISRSSPFHSTFKVIVIEEAIDSESTSGVNKLSGLVGLPNIIEVHKEEHGKYGMNDESGLDIKHGDEDNLDVLINMDNLYLKNEIMKRRNFDPEIIKYWFKYGLFLLAMGMLYDQKKAMGKNDVKEGFDFKPIATATKGLAVTIIPVMIQLRK